MTHRSRSSSPLRLFGRGALYAAAAVVIGSCKPLTVDDVLLVPTSWQWFGAPTDIVAGNTVDGFYVQIRDQDNEPLQGVQVTFTISGGSVSASNATTDSDGRASPVTWTPPTSSGSYTLTASVGGGRLSPLAFSINVTHAPPSALTKGPGTDEQMAAAGGSVDVPPAVRVEDQFGNAVPGVAIRFTALDGSSIITSPGSAPDVSGEIVSNGNGVASLDAWILSATGGPQSLRAEVTPNTSIFTVFTATSVLPPQAPSDLVATTLSTTQVALAWTDNATDEEGFKVERCEGSTCTDFAEIASVDVDATKYEDASAVEGTSYNYRVFAFNLGGSSEFSNVASATTFLNAPTGLSAVAASPTRIDLAWTDNATTETAYLVESCTGTGCTDFSEIESLPAGTTSYQHTGLSPLTEYSYRVRASNADLQSDYSNTASATTGAPSPDLVITAFGAPSLAQIGGTTNVTLTVTNQGSADVGAFKVGLYFSTDSDIGTDDQLSNSFCSFTGLVVGASASCSGAADVPGFLAPGSYFMGAYADHEFTVGETDETNNDSESTPMTLAFANLVNNGDFEAGATSDWSISGVATITSNSSLSRSGSFYVLMGTSNTATGSVYQDITIPADAINPTVTFYTNISTDETTTSNAFDFLSVTVRNTSNAIMQTLVTLSNLNSSGGIGSSFYAQHTFDLSAYVGQTIRLHYDMSTDGSLPTTFRIDDVSVTWTAP